MKLAISLFKNKQDTKAQLVQRTWQEVCKKFACPVVRAEKDGPLFSPATFSPPERKKANVKEISILMLDYDHKASLDEDIKVWTALGICFAVYTTHSHRRITDSNPNAEDRFRVVIPLAEPIPAVHYPSLWQWAANISGGKIDPQTKDMSRMFYVPAKASPDAPYEHRIVEGNLLNWREVIEVAEEPSEPHAETSNAPSDYATWDELNAELKRRILRDSTAKQNDEGFYHCRARCHDPKSDAGIMFNPATGAVKCLKGCSHAALLQSFGLPERPHMHSTGPSNGEEVVYIPKWPAPLKPAAFHGLAGDIVHTIEPHTEANPAAILGQFLVCFGNTIGRNAFFVAEADRHYSNLFLVLVGSTSKGRKGTSQGQVLNLYRSVDEDWAKDRLQSGLSSGEGLIWAVRDPIEKTEPIRDKRRITGYQKVVTDEGIDDKRLLAFEGEFAATLRVLGREGNTLSALLRQSWDTGNLRVMTKNNPAQSSGAHISIIGHITKDELCRYLDTTEAGNGFANRFLWFCVRRSKVLPFGGRLDEVNFSPLVNRLREAVSLARNTAEMTRDAEACALWAEVYEGLSEGKPGLLGAVTSRAEAQVMRLACVYALLDCSRIIRKPHLEAALAVWQYCEESARFTFGDSLGDPVADEILRSLRAAPNGLTRTDLSNLFGRNRSAREIGRALVTLSEQGLVYSQKAETDGRSAEKWFALKMATKETKETKEAPENGQSEDPSFVNFVNFVQPESEKAVSDQADDWGEL